MTQAETSLDEPGAVTVGGPRLVLRCCVRPGARATGSFSYAAVTAEKAPKLPGFLQALPSQRNARAAGFPAARLLFGPFGNFADHVRK